MDIGGIDADVLREIVSGPGIDPRQWTSFGIVEPRGPANGDNDPVAFTDEFGPLVNVVLQPSGIPVPCRVLGGVAGNGEAEYYPFMEGDEVLVLIPEGDERAGCTIIGRLNNEIDAWPKQVGGMDATKNLFAFRRMRTPYVVETSSSYMLRSAATGAFFSISQDGRITMSNADKAFIAMNPDFIGMQNADGSVLFQLDLQDKSIVLSAKGTKFTIADDSSSFSTSGTVHISGSGIPALEHATSVEGVVNMLNSLFMAWGPLITTALAGVVPNGPAIATALLGTMTPATILAMLALAGSGTIAPFGAAIGGALAQKPGDPTGNFPSVGAPGFLIG